jgi:hypothetical protein
MKMRRQHRGDQLSYSICSTTTGIHFGKPLQLICFYHHCSFQPMPYYREDYLILPSNWNVQHESPKLNVDPEKSKSYIHLAYEIETINMIQIIMIILVFCNGVILSLIRRIKEGLYISSTSIRKKYLNFVCHMINLF